MSGLSETIERKFVDSLEVSDWQIESEEGWVDITHINKTIEYDVYQLKTSNCSIECADNHIVFRENGGEVFVKDLFPGDIIKGEKRIETVISVIKTDRKENMYDLSVGGNHTYFSEGLLHHNTQTVAAYILWYTLFNDNKTVAILANKAPAAREIMSRYQMMYEYLPKWLQQGVKVWNKGNIELENGSKAFTSATTPAACRGKSVNFLYVDEAAIIANTIADEFFTSTYPTISSGKTTKIVLTSTPLGYNHFWVFWSKAEQKINGFTPVRVFWNQHPLKDQAWYDEQKSLLGDIKVAQEVDCSFVGSSYTLISGDHISRLTPTPYVFSKEGFDSLEYAKTGHTYVLIADTSEGVGGDNSAFIIIDITELPYTVVAKYKSNTVSPLMYPTVISLAALSYNNAYVLLEINKSEQVAYILQAELEYENILYVARGKSGQFVTAGFGGVKPALGVTTDKRVKRIGCSNLKTLIEENKLIVTDADVISEISTFVEHRGSYAADDGYKDDLVMTLVLFGWLTTQTYFKDLSNINLRTLLYQARMDEMENQMTPIGFLNTGKEDTIIEGEVMGKDFWVLAPPIYDL